MINQNFAIVGSFVAIIGALGYTWDTLKGNTKPNRISWTLWSAPPLIAFFGELSEHSNFKLALLTLALGIGPILVVLASFTDKRAYWKITGFDYFCGSISLLSIILWTITGNGNLAIFFSIIADLFAAIPTIRKAYSHPESESAIAFICGALGAGIALLTVQKWTFANCAFALYFFIGSATISALILYPRKSNK